MNESSDDDDGELNHEKHHCPKNSNASEIQISKQIK